MTIRDKAREQGKRNLEINRDFFWKKLNQRVSTSWLKRHFGSSYYLPHQNDGEKTKRLKNYPSLDLARYGR
jgi:hypothetical protein